jgi:hypothetical protein
VTKKKKTHTDASSEENMLPHCTLEMECPGREVTKPKIE